MAVSLSPISALAKQPNKPSGVFVALGSNQGFQSLSQRETLRLALHHLNAAGDQIIATSSLWKSDAWPKNNNAPDYTNAVCQIVPIDTNPSRLLDRLHAIEAKMGRQRDPKNQWSNRTLDLDLLDYNGLILENDSFLTLPHPRLAVRDFVLYPLSEICPKWRHPISGENVLDILRFIIKNGDTNNCQCLGSFSSESD